jgi:uncharacterized protein (TIGR03067 family)
LKESVTADLKALHGTWEVRGYTFNGYGAMAYVSARMSVMVRDDELSITPLEVMKVSPPNTETFGIVESFRARISVDPKSSPKSIDLRLPDDSKSLHGIYRLDGESLLICFSSTGRRSADFKAEKRSGYHFFTLKRPAQ